MINKFEISRKSKEFGLQPASEQNMGKRKKKNAAPYLDEPKCDENFQFIAGYTEGGAPFGMTWEEAKLMEERENLKALMKNEELKNCESPVDLVQLIDAFDIQSDHVCFYVNRASGEILSLTEIEDMEQDDESEIDASVLDSDEYAPLPSRWEFKKYEIMEEFVFSLEDSKMQEVLARAIRGKGAFGRFHTGIQAYKIQDQWYEYQNDRLREIAIEWCHQNQLAYK